MIYLDNSATTRVYDEVIDKITYIYKNANYNPSSTYNVASVAEKELEEARSVIARSINADKGLVYFTSGGSEGNNTAIQGVARACKNRGKHLITSSVEHDSVYNTFKYLEHNEGYQVDYLLPDEYGRISAKDVSDYVRKDTTLVSLMHVNNETGAINDVKDISKSIKEKNPMTIFHSDSVQSYMKLPVDVEDIGADMLTASAHKIHGPKGIGYIYIKRNTKVSPLIYGGGQEGGFRSGTENVALSSGFATAVKVILANENYRKKIQQTRNYLKEQIISNIKDIRINTPADGAPHILSVSFAGVKSEVLLHYLEMDKIYVSKGSACSAKKRGSRVLDNIKVPREYIDGTIRFSFDESLKEKDMDFVLEKLSDSVKKIRQVTKYRLRK